MAKPLTQDQINAIFAGEDETLFEENIPPSQEDSSASAASDEEVILREGKRRSGVEPYNFKRPRLFSQEKMRRLKRVHETFARDLAVYLSAQLRTVIDIKVEAIDQDLYSEFVMASVKPSALYIVDSDRDDKQFVIELDPRLVKLTVERLCGGSGKFPEKRAAITPIEERIMRKVMQRPTEELSGAWENGANFSVSSFESNAEFVQVLPGNDPAMVVTLQANVGASTSRIRICYSYLLLERLLTEAGMHGKDLHEELPPPGQRGPQELSLKDTRLELRAELGRTLLRGKDVINLEKGDLIPLRQRIDIPLQGFIEKKLCFEANPGRSGNIQSLKITEVHLDKNKVAN